MNEWTVRLAAQMYALVADMEAAKARIKGMERRNELNEIGYNEEAFFTVQMEIEDIARRLRQEI